MGKSSSRILKMAAFAFIYSAILTAAVAIAAPISEEKNWPKSVKYGSLILEFDQSMVKDGLSQSELRDCSDDKYCCAQSDIISLVFPRRCPSEMKIGDKWVAGGVKVRAVGSFAEPVGHLGQSGGTLFVVQPEGNGRVAVIYKPSVGPVAILYDRNRSIDLSWIKPDGSGSFSEIFMSKSLNSIYTPIDESKSIAICSH